MNAVNTRVPVLAAILGYAGLIPLLVCSISLWFAADDMRGIIDKALLTYAACILAFMGAVHWGAAMAGNTNTWQLGLSVVPALLAWLALNMPFPWGHSIIILSFSLLCMADSIAVRHKLLPGWYYNLRIPLTTVVVLSLISAVFALI